VSSLLRREFKIMDKKYLARKYLSRLLWLKVRRNRRQQKLSHSKATEFLKVWIAYNQDILNCIKKLDSNSFVVINYSMLNDADKGLFKHLENDWNFSLKYFKFKDVFKEGHIGKDIDIDLHIADKELIGVAKQLQRELKEYMQFS